MVKLCFDYGHGGSDPGAIYNGRKEAADVLSLGMEVAKDIRRHGVTVAETRTADVTMDLKERSDFGNQQNSDYFISFHRNAYKPELGTGVETYVYTTASPETRSLAEKLQKALVAVGFMDRGIKTANFHVLRETTASSVLIEIGFIDNSLDNALFDSKRKEIIKGISEAILTQAGIKYIEHQKITLAEALEVLEQKGIINSPEYWLENAMAGKMIKGEYVALLIERMGALLLK